MWPSARGARRRGFHTIYSNLEVVRGQFLKRDRAADLARRRRRGGIERFMLYPDGAWRSREEFYEPAHLLESVAAQGLPAHAAIPDAASCARRRSARMCSPAGSTRFPASISFSPGRRRWASTRASRAGRGRRRATTISSGGVGEAGEPERNPSRRGFVWTGVFVDPPTGKPFVTVQLPVDKDGEQIATVAHDMHINQLFDEMRAERFRGRDASHLPAGWPADRASRAARRDPRQQRRCSRRRTAAIARWPASTGSLSRTRSGTSPASSR